MQKKIIEHGTSGAVVVPKKWMDKYDLKKGDTLELEEIGPKLTLSIEKIGPLKESIKLQQNPFISRI
jgi:bifunctional DNA-binding transcriptional regulator/antitoxin component of YhaV-PrlF toxin-antitoxin module